MKKLPCWMRLTVFVLVCLVFPRTSLWANDTAYFGSGNTVVPINNQQIRMVSESIRIHREGNLFDDRWQVNCRFVFQNASDSAVTVLMGFPDYYVDYPNGKSKEWTIGNFKASVKDVALTVEHRIVNHPEKSLLGAGEDGAYVWKVDFQPGELITVKNSYDTGAVESPPQFYFTYVVKTGARWHGKIESAEFEIDLSKIPYSPFFEIKPPPHSMKAGVYKLRFENLKPDFNIQVKGSHVRKGGEPIDDVIGSLGAEMWNLADLAILRGYSEPPPPGILETWWLKLTRGKSEKDPDRPNRRPYSESPLYKFLVDRRVDRESAALLRNYVFASRGRLFENATFRAYFAKQKWYKPDANYSDDKLSDYDKEFVATVKAYEDSLGIEAAK